MTMATRQIVYDEIKQSVATIKNKDGTEYEFRSDDKSGIFLLKESIDDANEALEDNTQRVAYRPSVKEGKPGLDIHLPSGVDFRVDNKHITVSDFGLTSAQIKDLRQFFYMHGIESFSLPNAEDCEFEEKLQQAENELGNAPLQIASGERQDLPPEPSANDNEPSPTEGMSEEEIVAYKRGLTEAAKVATSLQKSDKSLNYDGKKKLVYPSQEGILQAFHNHVNNTQKDMSDNYKINSISNGYELVFYTDSEQKNDGAEADKKGHIKPNYQFALRGEIFHDKSGDPKLSITFMTPKYGKMDDWMFDEVMNLADDNKLTHLKFSAGLQHKAAFFGACAKKMIIPTGVKLKKKDVEDMINIAKKNNDKTEDRKNYYLRLAAQLEENMQKENTYADEGHPFHEIIKNLRDDARNEGTIAASKLKYKKFNQFYENNIMGKALPDSKDDKKPQYDAVKVLAGGKAYVDFLTQYRDNETFEKLPDEAKKAFYEERYNVYVYQYEQDVMKAVEGIEDSPKGRKLRRETIEKELYQPVKDEISDLVTNLEYDLGVKVDRPTLISRDYMGDKVNMPNPNETRIKLGKNILDERERARNGSQNNTPPPLSHDGRS